MVSNSLKIIDYGWGIRPWKFTSSLWVSQSDPGCPSNFGLACPNKLFDSSWEFDSHPVYLPILRRTQFPYIYGGVWGGTNQILDVIWEGSDIKAVRGFK